MARQFNPNEWDAGKAKILQGLQLLRHATGTHKDQLWLRQGVECLCRNVRANIEEFDETMEREAHCKAHGHAWTAEADVENGGETLTCNHCGLQQTHYW